MTTEATKISPTVGRVVWYHAYATDHYPGAGDGPQAAIITKVWSDTCVNLTVFDANGNPFGRTSVLLFQEGNLRPDSGYCEWMPYQKGQAAKTEQLQEQLRQAQG